MSVVLPAEHLAKVLGHSFSDPRLLRQALTHRSFSSTHNERLEFVGDSVLNAVVARALFVAFPQLTEGELSRLRASLVCQDALAEVAGALHLGDYLNLGEGELKSGGHRRPSILADALEALFGAIWFDAGFEAAQAVVERLFAPRIAGIDPSRALKDAKTALQEWLQARRVALPQYLLLRQEGDSPNQIFEVGCRIESLGVETRAEGASRRVAEQAAAADALGTLKDRYPGKAKRF
ncbi:ribonuclease III [Chitiniphilus eburneus]|uniref:Ribonuclease 3 n=1 Tax=Chitiniphilus eburneus TaxID=2571148 RepID=A0A4U0PIP0_9NEIS|nr:ribonuclease III [Chitiniphilus eburneus]TJZ67775.1 ribonuclease III [Chitiniphilus eburneus]